MFFFDQVNFFLSFFHDFNLVSALKFQMKNKKECKSLLIGVCVCDEASFCFLLFNRWMILDASPNEWQLFFFLKKIKASIGAIARKKKAGGARWKWGGVLFGSARREIFSRLWEWVKENNGRNCIMNFCILKPDNEKEKWQASSATGVCDFILFLALFNHRLFFLFFFVIR